MKKILLYISFLFLSTSLFAQAKIGPDGNVQPTGNYPVVKNKDIQGALHSFKTIAERDALIDSARQVGMLAYVDDSTKYYKLIGGITNSDWQEWKGGNGGCLVTFYTTPDSIYLVKDSCGAIIDSTMWVGDTSGISGIQSVQAGNNITIDTTDPSNPIINSVLTAVTASNGLTRVGDDISLGGSLNSNVFIAGNKKNLWFIGCSQTLFTVSGTNPSGFTGNFSSSFSQVNGVNSLHGIFTDSATTKNIIYDILGDKNGVLLHNRNDFSLTPADRPYESSLLSFSRGVKITTFGVAVGGDTAFYSSSLIIKVDSSKATPNNIAYFDNDTLKRGSVTQLPITSLSTDPTTTDIPAGFTAVFTNTTTGHTYLWANVAGSLLKTELTP